MELKVYSDQLKPEYANVFLRNVKSHMFKDSYQNAILAVMKHPDGRVIYHEGENSYHSITE